jgi:hypothetical protein
MFCKFSYMTLIFSGENLLARGTPSWGISGLSSKPTHSTSRGNSFSSVSAIPLPIKQ